MVFFMFETGQGWRLGCMVMYAGVLLFGDLGEEKYAYGGIDREQLILICWYLVTLRSMNVWSIET
jgi:hypothetical protein